MKTQVNYSSAECAKHNAANAVEIEAGIQLEWEPNSNILAEEKQREERMAKQRMEEARQVKLVLDGIALSNYKDEVDKVRTHFSARTPIKVVSFTLGGVSISTTYNDRLEIQGRKRPFSSRDRGSYWVSSHERSSTFKLDGITASPAKLAVWLNEKVATKKRELDEERKREQAQFTDSQRRSATYAAHKLTFDALKIAESALTVRTVNDSDEQMIHAAVRFNMTAAQWTTLAMLVAGNNLGVV